MFDAPRRAGLPANPLIDNDLGGNGQKEPVLEVGRVTPCAPVFADGPSGERRAEDCPPYHQYTNTSAAVGL
jgi:hypothetical protein